MAERELPEREIPGRPMQRWSEPYGFERHVQEIGRGTNMLRTERLAQPSALKQGDILATGDEVLSEPRVGFNGSIWVQLTGGFDGHWIDLPARIPVALLTPEDNAPQELWEEHIKHKPRERS